MRKLRLHGGIRLGGADVHAAEYLCGIDADDVARIARGNLAGQRGFAAGGGADEKNRRGMLRERIGWQGIFQAIWFSRQMG